MAHRSLLPLSFSCLKELDEETPSDHSLASVVYSYECLPMGPHVWHHVQPNMESLDWAQNKYGDQSGFFSWRMHSRHTLHRSERSVRVDYLGFLWSFINFSTILLFFRLSNVVLQW